MQPQYTTEQSSSEIPYGYCHCGCGEKTTIINRNDNPRGRIKGQFNQFITGHANKGKHSSAEERFWRKVEKTSGCWFWTAAKIGRGYGDFIPNGTKHMYAHRYSWVLVHGAIPHGMFVCHKCDNPSCVNPCHLFLGTCADNMADMARKDRQSSKLNSQQVREIRVLLALGASDRSLARQFNVNRRTIAFIKDGVWWRHS